MSIFSPWLVALLMILSGASQASEVTIEAPKPVVPTPENTKPLKLSPMPEFKTDIPCYPTALVMRKAKAVGATLVLSGVSLDGAPFVVYGYPDNSVAVLQGADKTGDMLCQFAVLEEVSFNIGQYLSWKSKISE